MCKPHAQYTRPEDKIEFVVQSFVKIPHQAVLRHQVQPNTCFTTHTTCTVSSSRVTSRREDASSCLVDVSCCWVAVRRATVSVC